LSQNQLISWILVIAGGLCFIGALIIGLGPCSNSILGAALFKIQTCEQTTAELYLLAFFGCIFAGVGIIMLRKQRMNIAVASQKVRRQYCQSCGASIPLGADFCHKCGEKQLEQVERVENIPTKSIKQHSDPTLKVVAVIIIVVAVWAAYSFTQPSSTPTNLTVTYTSTNLQSGAPNFTLPIVGSNGLTGQTITLSSFQGEVVFLQFMEPWAPHCQHMTPILDSLYGQYGGNVVFIMVMGPWNGAAVTDTSNFIQVCDQRTCLYKSLLLFSGHTRVTKLTI
jgi:thiol-disulfide isomerase/thioredoxin/ribosomal protein L40E